MAFVTRRSSPWVRKDLGRPLIGSGGRWHLCRPRQCPAAAECHETACSTNQCATPRPVKSMRSISQPPTPQHPSSEVGRCASDSASCESIHEKVHKSLRAVVVAKQEGCPRGSNVIVMQPRRHERDAGWHDGTRGVLRHPLSARCLVQPVPLFGHPSVLRIAKRRNSRNSRFASFLIEYGTVLAATDMDRAQ